MKKFDVYPKEGDIFTLELKRFSFDDKRFVLYDSIDQPSDAGFLSFENVAAICVADQPRPNWEDIRTFEVYLKNRKEPLKIFAHYFKMATSSSVEFYWVKTTGPTDLKIENIYIAVSEVVAIVPAGGLNKFW